MSLDCPRTTATASTQQPIVVDLDARARRAQPAVSGAKAAALARAKAAGLSGAAGVRRDDRRRRATWLPARAGRRHAADLHEAWKALSDTGRRALVVRSSSTIEDGGSQSMAGLFTSVLDVQGWEAFLAAVDEVVALGRRGPDRRSRAAVPPAGLGRRAVRRRPGDRTHRPPRGRRRARRAGPAVSGQVDGVQLTLTAPRPARRGAATTSRPSCGRGAPVASSSTSPAVRRRRSAVRRTSSGRSTPAATIVLLQSRPITAVGDEARATGPVFGPGPGRRDVRAATPTARGRPVGRPAACRRARGAADHRRHVGRASCAASPAVVVVGGRVAADLDLLGLTAAAPVAVVAARPRPPARRLKAAWRVGRLRVALPALADDLLARGRRRPAARCRRSTTLTDAELRPAAAAVPARRCGPARPRGARRDAARRRRRRNPPRPRLPSASSPRRRPIVRPTTTSSSPRTPCCSASCRRPSVAPVSLPPPPASPPVAPRRGRR